MWIFPGMTHCLSLSRQVICFLPVHHTMMMLHVSIRKLIFTIFSSMAATCFVQPLDLVKTRMQMSGKNENKDNIFRI